MSMIVGIQEKNLKLVEQFEQTVFWLPENGSFFHEHFHLEFPFAPPGWFQDMNEYETRTHFEWLNRSVKNWKWENSTVYATNLPDTFWIIRDGEGDVFWNTHDGHFKSRFLTMVQLQDDKIIYMKDHFDNVHVYEAAGIKLPTFIYDAPAPESVPERPEVPKLQGEELQKNAIAAVKSMVCVDFWEDDGTSQTLANEFVHGLPFTPPDMPRYYNLREYDALNVWLQENTKNWVVYPGTVLYETDHEGEYIIESGGSGNESWSHCPDGFYQNRHVSYLKVENGYAVNYDEYFDPLKKFNSINISIPSFPYLF